MESVGSPAQPTLSFLPAMTEIAATDVLQQLDERHEQLLVELDILNERIEAALKPFGKAAITEGSTEKVQ